MIVFAPLRRQTPDQLRAERTYWMKKLRAVEDLRTILDNLEDCERELSRRGEKIVLE